MDERHLEIIVAENAWPGRAATEAQAEAEKLLAEGWRLHSVQISHYLNPRLGHDPEEIVHVCTITLIRD